ncbi:uncharacterized protein LOC112141294 isoform X1 [Oryzias melastigma]|uniref:uncharacterized protein LOC112141294 isoform X1 n=1 Tax=Oryzias melastigma TaxID=30732 RepID=UPI00168D28A9|nr:uncharacterized protein LOC112141294 isoform X1 [Oryzias melastigma]XP_036072271.1 uncharacterized protein LOC112141294 isoform X1 [Oryzias melastigma]
MFRGETITLTCEVQGGEGVQWEYQWRTPQSQTSWRNNKDWTITASISGEYSCKSRSTYYSYSSTNWSEALRLSVSAHKPKSELNMTKSPVEGRVNMSCLVKNSSSGWRFFWFRGEKSSKLLTTQDADFLSNGQISVSQEGVYRCRGGRGEPVYHSEFSDPVIVDATSRPVSSSFPVLVFVLTSVILVILIFLIWFFCRRSRDSKMIRLVLFIFRKSITDVFLGVYNFNNDNHSTYIYFSRSQDNNQITAADHTEGQHRNDDVLLHGPEGIQNDPEDENTSESRMVTYSSIKFKTFNKKKKRQKPAENSVYSDVKTGASADVSQLYAEVKKKNKGKSSQSVDEMIYSEVQ